MDEILASIRRIIENSDEDMVRNTSAAAPQNADAQSTARSGPFTGGRLDVRPGEAQSAPADAPAPDQAPPAALFSSSDEDDLAARLQRELEADSIGEWPTPPSPPVPSAATVNPFETETTHPTRADREPVPAPAEEMKPEAPFQPANSDSRRMQDFRSAVIEDLEGQIERDGGVPLVSGRTGELVGASFDELAQAIRQGELRSLEDMAQELLRPMLQDWLDDNLPNLVERLVREEIERVARGGRR